MSEAALAFYTLFVFAVGVVSMWMWTQLEKRDLQDELAREQETNVALRARLDQARIEMLAATASSEWLSRLSRRLTEELEMERVVSDAYAAGIQREET